MFEKWGPGQCLQPRYTLERGGGGFIYLLEDDAVSKPKQASLDNIMTKLEEIANTQKDLALLLAQATGIVVGWVYGDEDSRHKGTAKVARESLPKFWKKILDRKNNEATDV